MRSSAVSPSSWGKVRPCWTPSGVRTPWPPSPSRASGRRYPSPPGRRRTPSWPNRDSLERTTLFESIEIQVVTAAGTFSAPPQNAQYRASSRLTEWQVPQTMPSTTCVPQFEQNCERGATGWPQEGQCMPSSGSFAPQVPQNVPSWRFLAPQARQTFDRRSLAPQELQNKSSSRFIRPHDRQSIAPLPSVPADVVPPEERA